MENNKVTRTTAFTQLIRPNDWNYNKQDEVTFVKQVKSMKKHGVISDIQVMRDPEDNDRFIIINGEHRWKAAINLGLEELPITIIENITVEEAIEIAIKLNEIGGDPDPLILSALLHKTGIPYDILLDEMPWSSSEFKNLFELNDFNIESFNNVDEEGSSTDLPEDEYELDEKNKSDIRLNFVLSNDDFQVYHSLKQRLKCLNDNDTLMKMCSITNGYLNSKPKRRPFKRG